MFILYGLLLGWKKNGHIWHWHSAYSTRDKTANKEELKVQIVFIDKEKSTNRFGLVWFRRLVWSQLLMLKNKNDIDPVPHYQVLKIKILMNNC